MARRDPAPFAAASVGVVMLCRRLAAPGCTLAQPSAASAPSAKR